MTPTGLPADAFDLAVADPAWPFAVRGEGGHGKSPEAHYRTMPLSEIAALQLGDLLRDGGLMILWTTWPLLVTGEISAVLAAWECEARTAGVWAKRTASRKARWGPGYLARSLCEPFVLATRRPRRRRRAIAWQGARFPNLIETVGGALVDGLAREHSRKPDEFYALVERASPGAARADLFARQWREGWIGWGDELTKFGGAA